MYLPVSVWPVELCIVKALGWLASKDPQEVMAFRESMILKLDEADRAMRQSGLCDEWFEGADWQTKAVAGAANGPLLSALLSASGYVDMTCAELLRKGAYMIQFTFVACMVWVSL